MVISPHAPAWLPLFSSGSGLVASNQASEPQVLGMPTVAVAGPGMDEGELPLAAGGGILCCSFGG